MPPFDWPSTDGIAYSKLVKSVYFTHYIIVLVTAVGQENTDFILSLFVLCTCTVSCALYPVDSNVTGLLSCYLRAVICPLDLYICCPWSSFSIGTDTLAPKELLYDSELRLNILSDLVSVESLEVASSPNDSCVASAILSPDCFILLQACCSNSEHICHLLKPSIAWQEGRSI